MIHPTILIGLGDYGDRIVQESIQAIKEKGDIYGKLITDLVIDANGKVKSHLANKEFDELAIQTNSNVCQSGVFASNLQAYFNKEEKIDRHLSTLIDDMVDLETRQQLISQDLGDLSKYRVLVFAPMFDAIGSVLAQPMLKMIAKIFKSKEIEVFGAFLMPDLAESDKMIKQEDEEPETPAHNCQYARTYCAINELETELEDHGSLVDQIFVLSKKNINDHSIGRFSDMLNSLGEFSYLVFRGRLSVIDNAHLYLNEVSNGKVSRFSSLGLATLTFPEKEIIDTYQRLGKVEVLGKLNALFAERSINRNQVNLAIDSFVQKNGLLDLYELNGLDQDVGTAIFRPMENPALLKEETTPDDFFKDFAEKEKQYKLNEFNLKIGPAYDGRANKISASRIEAYQEAINTKFKEGENGINQAHAFSALLMREDCDCVTDADNFADRDMVSAEQDLLKYFQDKMGKDIGAAHIKHQERTIKSLQRELNDINKKIRRAHQKVESELQKIRSGEKATDVDRIKFQSELDSHQEEAQRISKELNDQMSGFKDAYKDYEQFKNSLKKKSTTAELLEKDRQAIQTSLNQTKNAIHEEESKLIDANNRVAKWKEKSRRFIRLWLVIIPVVLTVVLLGILMMEENALENLGVYLGIILLILAVYFVVNYIRYRKQCKLPLEEAQTHRDGIATQKLQLMRNYVDSTNQGYQIQAEYLQHESAYKSFEEIQTHIQTQNDQIVNFKRAIREAYEVEKEQLEDLEFKNNLFVRYITSKDNIIDYFKGHNSSAGFLKSPDSLLKYYQAFQKKESINDLMGDLNEFFAKDARVMSGDNIHHKLLTGDYDRSEYISIDQAQGNANSASNDLKREIRKLVDASEPYIYLETSFEANETYNMTQLCLDIGYEEADQIKALVKEEVKQNTNLFPIDDKNHINLLKLLIGFPAYKISILGECYENFNKLCGDDVKSKEAFYAQKYALNKDIFPSIVRMGGVADRQRKCLAFGRLMGLISERNGDVYFKDDKIGTNIEDASNFLSLQKGRSTLEALEEEIQAHKKRYMEGDENLVRKMKNFLVYDNNGFDEIDYRIVKEFDPRNI